MSLSQYLKKFPVIHDRLLTLIASPTRRRLARGAFWGGVATCGTRVFSLLGSFLLARILGKSGFGEYGMINNTSAMIGNMAGLGIGITIIKYVAELKARDPARVGRIIALSTMVTVGSALVYGGSLIAFAPLLAAKTLAAPHLAPMLQISAITLALGVVNSVQSSSLTGCESFKVMSFINVIQSISQVILVVVGAYLWGVSGAVVMVAISTILVVVITRWFVTKEWKRFGITLKWKDAWKEWHILVCFSLPTFLGGLSIGPVMWICNAFLANRYDGYEQLGVYNAANQWQAAIQFIPSLIGAALLPVMSERQGSGDSSGCLNITLKTMVITAYAVVPTSVIICLLSPVIMNGYGASFASGYRTLCLSVITAALLAVITPVGLFITANGKMWFGLLLNMGWGFSMILFSRYMVKWGAEGLACAGLSAYLIHSIWHFAYLRMKFNELKNEKALCKR